MWVFGYGSLLWYQDFPYDKVLPGVVRGYSRRFWQYSPDHRGTPENPGNTVTLVRDEDGDCWGLAFHVAEEHVLNTKEYLDFREQAGYECREVEFHPDDGSKPFTLNVYIATVDLNPYFKGPLDDDVVVSTILRSRGKSGTNLEYALRLADCVHRLAPHVNDEHLFGIEHALLEKCRLLNVQDSVLHALGYTKQ
uniref:glutathione-specific gamma-glutamylcyclotransferase n=1 Tax=Syphacia muris TaxID=451379 RepID=A0A0N5ACA4_9BILA